MLIFIQRSRFILKYMKGVRSILLLNLIFLLSFVFVSVVNTTIFQKNRQSTKNINNKKTDLRQKKRQKNDILF